VSAESWSDDCEMRWHAGGWQLHPKLRREYEKLFDALPDNVEYVQPGVFAKSEDAREAAQRVWRTGRSRFYALHYERNRHRKYHAGRIARETGREEWDNDVQYAAEAQAQADTRRQRKAASEIAQTPAPYEPRGGRPSGRSAISNAELQKRYAALPLKERRSFTRAATAIRAALPVNVRRMTGFGVSSLRQRLSRLTINPRK